MSAAAIKVKVFFQHRTLSGDWGHLDLESGLVGRMIFDQWVLDSFNEGEVTKGLHLCNAIVGGSMAEPLFEPILVEVREGAMVFEGWNAVMYNVPTSDGAVGVKAGEKACRWIVYPIESPEWQRIRENHSEGGGA